MEWLIVSGGSFLVGFIVATWLRINFHRSGWSFRLVTEYGIQPCNYDVLAARTWSLCTAMGCHHPEAGRGLMRVVACDLQKWTPDQYVAYRQSGDFARAVAMIQDLQGWMPEELMELFPRQRI
jgi:hypothetical protein